MDNAKRAVREHRFDEAEEHYIAALKEAPGSNPRLADGIVSLAQLYVAQGKPKAAERLLKRALAIQERNLGPGHPAVADSLNNLGILYHGQKKYETAERLHAQALAIQEKALGWRAPARGDALPSRTSSDHDRGCPGCSGCQPRPDAPVLGSFLV